jgi:hypothetical protein
MIILFSLVCKIIMYTSLEINQSRLAMLYTFILIILFYLMNIQEIPCVVLLATSLFSHKVANLNLIQLCIIIVTPYKLLDS